MTFSITRSDLRAYTQPVSLLFKMIVDYLHRIWLVTQVPLKIYSVFTGDAYRFPSFNFLWSIIGI